MKTAYFLSALIFGAVVSTHSQYRALLSAGSFVTRDSLAQRISWKPFDAPTIGVQTLSSVGVGGIVFGSTFAIARNQSGNDLLRAGEQIVVYVLGSLLGAVAIPLSVYYSGQWMGGNGDQTWTFLGAMGGSGLGILLIALPGNIDGGMILTYVAAMGIAGTILGYHFSSSTVYEGTERNSMSTFPRQIGEPALSSRYLQVLQISITF